MNATIKNKTSGIMEVFTDGSCIRRKKILCGYGIHFPNKEIPDISRTFTREPLTNQRAELFAIYVALILISKKIILDKRDKIIIYSDSEYSIKCLTVWIHDWIKKSWILSTGKVVKNQDILKPIHEIMNKFKCGIEFVHVRSHTNKKDYESIGNKIADELATRGAYLT